VILLHSGRRSKSRSRRRSHSRSRRRSKSPRKRKSHSRERNRCSRSRSASPLLSSVVKLLPRWFINIYCRPLLQSLVAEFQIFFHSQELPVHGVVVSWPVLLVVNVVSLACVWSRDRRKEEKSKKRSKTPPKSYSSARRSRSMSRWVSELHADCCSGELQAAVQTVHVLYVHESK